MNLRHVVAVGLVRAAARVLAGHDDHVVILNTNRMRNLPGKPDAGLIKPFLLSGGKTALSFSPDDAPESLGTPVPERIARLAGYDVDRIS
jgi:hypothetical protein